MFAQRARLEVRLRVLVFVSALLTLANVARADIPLTTADGYVFDIQDDESGQIHDGSRDAYDDGYFLEVNGVPYETSGAAAALSDDGRTVRLPTRVIGGASVRREIYVPESGASFVRYLDVIENRGDRPLPLSVVLRGNVGSDSETRVFATSSGDDVVGPGDRWFGTDDVADTADPAVAHVVGGRCTLLDASHIEQRDDAFTWEHRTELAPRERIAVLSFGVQADSRDAVATEAERLAGLPDDAIVGLDDYLDLIVNFGAAAPGEPRVCFGGDGHVSEGSAIEVSVSFEDDDHVSFSWDTDDNGAFEEHFAEPSISLPQGSIDDGALRLTVRATDGDHIVTRTRVVLIDNDPPVIASSPPPMTSVGARYRYAMRVEDPGGENDPLFFHLVRGPAGMTVDEQGVVSFLPNESHITSETNPAMRVAVMVEDDDGGHDVQEWALMVSPDRAPSDAIPLYPANGIGLLERMPRLVAQNAVDPDGDPLQYFFELTKGSSYETDDVIASGPVAEGDGFTAYPLEVALSPGEYHWRVWLFDGTIETEPRETTFWVLRDPNAPPEVSYDDPGDGRMTLRPSGVAETRCSVPGAVPARGALLPRVVCLGTVVALLAIRRRRRG